MKSSNTRPATLASRFREGCVRTFGFEPRMPRFGLKTSLAVALVAVFAAGAAAAAWQVNDVKTQEKLGQLIGTNKGTVTGQLDDINSKLSVDKRNGEGIAEMVKEPEGDEKLEKDAPTSVQMAMADFCPPGVSNAFGQNQQALCQELYQTELAQYRFSMRMFERSKENYDRLKKIQDRLGQLDANDYANLQYNTNELLALTAQMDNDRDRYRTYMSAYEARIAHIQNVQASLTRNAFKGKKSVSVPTPPTL